MGIIAKIENSMAVKNIDDIISHGNKFIIDREGKKYSGEVTLINNNTYELELNELNPNNNGVVQHTDIFSWALFLPNTNKIIQFDQYR